MLTTKTVIQETTHAETYDYSVNQETDLKSENTKVSHDRWSANQDPKG
jgi:hypothetical protein